MATNSATVDQLRESETGAAARIDDYLREVKEIRREMKKTDSEIRRLHSATQKTIAETRAILRDIQGNR